MDFFNDLFGGELFNNNNPNKYSDDYNYDHLEVILRKKTFEKNLDDMWKVYIKGNTKQIVEYNKQKETIKRAGFKIFRNSQGIHKIIEQ